MFVTRSASTSRSSAGCSCCRSRSATSSTSSSWSTAPRRARHRRQLHRPERPVLRLRRADRAVRARRGAPRRRRVHPLAVAARADDRRLVPRLDPHRAALPGGHPAVHGRAQPVRPGGAVHRQQHRDDAARLRTRRLGGRPAVPRRGGADRGGDRATRRTRSATPGCGTTGRSATTLDQLQTVPPVLRLRRRRHRPLHHRRRPAPGDALGARARSEQNPRRRLGQPADHLHPRHRRRDGPGQRGHAEGQPRLFIRNLPPVSSEGAPEITEPRIYFGERPSSYVIVGARQTRVRLPDRRGPRRLGGRETRWTGTPGSRSTRR